MIQNCALTPKQRHFTLTLRSDEAEKSSTSADSIYGLFSFPLKPELNLSLKDGEWEVALRRVTMPLSMYNIRSGDSSMYMGVVAKDYFPKRNVFLKAGLYTTATELAAGLNAAIEANQALVGFIKFTAVKTTDTLKITLTPPSPNPAEHMYFYISSQLCSLLGFKRNVTYDCTVNKMEISSEKPIDVYSGRRFVNVHMDGIEPGSLGLLALGLVGLVVLVQC